MTVFFILTFVMPKVSKLFADLGQALPWPTRVLMATSKFLIQGWFVMIPAAVLIFFSSLRWSQSAKGRLALDGFKLRLPLIGPILLKVEFARFCRTLEMLTKNGVSLLRGLQIAIPTLNNAWIRQDLALLGSGLESGNSLSKSFQTCKLVPPMMVHLVGVGEESGLLTETLHDIADTYEEETAEAIKALTTILEPVMILLVGLVVGFIVFAMLLPIFGMDALAR
jgi:type II secretory pathway component PulF